MESASLPIRTAADAKTAAAAPDTVTAAASDAGPLSLVEQYRAVRRQTERLCAPLEAEDCVLQSMPEASPVRWHLAHTTWFFETFVLAESDPRYRPVDPRYAHLFNSYYNAVGKQFPRAARGLLSRPTVAEVWAYRRTIDRRIEQWLQSADPREHAQRTPAVVLGLHHEQQHQELILTDVKHALSQNPLFPAYAARAGCQSDTDSAAHDADLPPLGWRLFDGGLAEIGTSASEPPPFFYDNEGPRHRVYLEPFALASRLVTCGEYLAFMRDGGYDNPEHWLSDGFTQAQTEGWRAPLYWRTGAAGDWQQFTLAGLRPVDPHEPVCHLSFYEADAYARWAGARLPTEVEWEHAAADHPIRGNFAESGRFHPAPLRPDQADATAPAQLFGDVWEWTGSPYRPYPGYRSAPGALGEYNGKFMCNQFVLRGGSCATPQSHIRATYRNYFQPAARWQFAGIRLARDAASPRGLATYCLTPPRFRRLP